MGGDLQRCVAWFPDAVRGSLDPRKCTRLEHTNRGFYSVLAILLNETVQRETRAIYPDGLSDLPAAQRNAKSFVLVQDFPLPLSASSTCLIVEANLGM